MPESKVAIHLLLSRIRRQLKSNSIERFSLTHKITPFERYSITDDFYHMRLHLLWPKIEGKKQKTNQFQSNNDFSIFAVGLPLEPTKQPRHYKIVYAKR